VIAAFRKAGAEWCSPRFTPTLSGSSVATAPASAMRNHLSPKGRSGMAETGRDLAWPRRIFGPQPPTAPSATCDGMDAWVDGPQACDQRAAVRVAPTRIAPPVQRDGFRA